MLDADPRITINRSFPGDDAVHTVTVGLAALRKSPDAEAEQVNELRFGDTFTVYEQRDGWAYGQSNRDHYVGHVRGGSLSRGKQKPTHRVSNAVSFLFPEASIKSPPLDRLTFLSAVEVVGEEEKFCEIKGGGFIHRQHLVAMNAWRETDPVSIAQRFIDVPYLWGGVSPLGFDCSGLIQAVHQACGITCRRDSDMQADTLGNKIAKNENEVPLKRGDIVFIKGHVGLMVDEKTLIHANAFHGRVTQEPLADVTGRGDAVIGIRRI